MSTKTDLTKGLPRRTTCPECGGTLVPTGSGACCYEASIDKCAADRIMRYRAPEDTEEAERWTEEARYEAWKSRARPAAYDRSRRCWFVTGLGDCVRLDVGLRQAFVNSCELAMTPSGRLIVVRPKVAKQKAAAAAT